MELGVVSVAVAAAAGFATAILLRRKQSRPVPPPSAKPASAYHADRGVGEELGFPGLKGLDLPRSFAGTAKGVSTPRASGSLSYGNTAEKPLKEQASVKTDLDMAHPKLKKTMEQIHVLEAKLEEALNENAKLKVRQTEDAKLWKGLDSKLSLTKTVYNQLTGTLQHLECQARAAEEEKKILEKKLVENSKAVDNLSTKLNDLTMPLETADNTIRIGNREMLELRHEKEELEKTFRDERSTNDYAIKGKDTVIKQLEEPAEENSARLQTLDSHLQRMQQELMLKEDKIRGLEHESEALVSKKNESDKLIAELGLEVKYLTESASQTDIQTQELLQKFLRLESENNDLQDKVQTLLQEKAEERETLQNEIGQGTQHHDSLENQISELRNVLEEKEQLYLRSVEREKQLEAQRSEIQELLAASESKLIEAKKQYDIMLEGKKIELSKHLKELCQRSDQAINEIRKKYESEKVEIVNVEKEKADKLIKEMERKCDEKLSENKEEAQQYLMRVKGEHGAMIIRIQQDHDQKESSLQTQHKDELKRIQLHAETEMREKVSSLSKEHEIEIKSLTMEHEDACRRLMEELELQQSKMRWKVMSENQQRDQEVNFKNVSRLESENNDLQDKVHTVLQEKAEERETLGTQHRDSLGNQMSELRNVLEEKEQLYLSSVEREEQLEAQRSEVIDGYDSIYFWGFVL